jgi:tyrosine-protein kinase Etk/Wzc
LGLELVVASPRGTPPSRVVGRLELHGPFRPVKLRLEPAADGGVHVSGKGVDTTIARGGSLRLGAGTLSIADSAVLPATVQLFDREDAITRATKRLEVARTGGDVIGVGWPAEDSLSAPAAANFLIDQFLLRRRGVDRTLNQRRLEFVSRQNDSVDRALNDVLGKQRQFHERAETVDPAVSAKAYLESLIRLREQRETLVMEEGALSHLQEQLKSHAVQPRQLAAYPAFLRSPAINELLGRIGALEADRASLLERQRREDDPAVAAVRASIAKLESELEPLARTYVDAIGQQRVALDSEIALVNSRLAQLPGQVESAYQYAREVERLSRTSLALNAQRVELRLATIGEGGEARAVDVAQVQWKRSYPSKMLTLLMGLVAGLALGVALALMRAPERHTAAHAGG